MGDGRWVGGVRCTQSFDRLLNGRGRACGVERTKWERRAGAEDIYRTSFNRFLERQPYCSHGT